MSRDDHRGVDCQGPAGRARRHRRLRRQHCRAAGRRRSDSVLRSPRALSYLLTAPSQLGLARAYVSGELEIHGDLTTALQPRLERPHRQPVVAGAAQRAARRRPQGAALGRPTAGGVRRPPAAPAVCVTSKARDAAAISHHYDVSNSVLRVGARPVDDLHLRRASPTDDATLEEAQEHKYDLVCAQARAAARHAAARRRLRLGRHGPPRRQALRRAGARRDAVASSGGVGEGGDRAARVSGTSPRCGSATTATSPRATSTRSPRSV